MVELGVHRGERERHLFLSLLSLKILGTRQEWGSPQFLHCLTKPYQDSEKWKSFKKYRTTECTSQKEGRSHLNLPGGLVPAPFTGSPASFAVT